MTIFRRWWLVGAVIGAVVALMTAAAGAAVPQARWYWTMAVSPTNPKVLVLGTNAGLYRSVNGGKTWHTTGPTNLNATSLVRVGNTIFAGGVVESPMGPATLTVHGQYIVPTGQGVLEASTERRRHLAAAPSERPPRARRAGARDRSGELQVPLRRAQERCALQPRADGGHSFKLVTHKVGGTPWALAITQPGHLVAGDMTTGNFVSADATHWLDTGFTDPQKGKMVMEYAVQPTDTAARPDVELRRRQLDGRRQDLDELARLEGDVRPGRLGGDHAHRGLRGRLRQLALADERRREDLDEGRLAPQST